MKIKLTVEYDGTNYSGWQRQNNALTVQETIEKSFFELTGEKVTVQGAGRTDAGVHALGQCAHMVTECSIPPEKIAFALNTKLPPDIRIRKSEKVSEDFHATLDAKKKHYRYTIYNYPHASAINARFSAHVFYTMDIDKMKEAASILIGEHDFKAFSAAGSDIKTSVRTIYDIKITRENDYVYIDIWGNGFLYNMVRIIAGALTDIATGKTDQNTLKRALESKDRTVLGATMPAKGLTMVEVFY